MCANFVAAQEAGRAGVRAVVGSTPAPNCKAGRIFFVLGHKVWCAKTSALYFPETKITLALEISFPRLVENISVPIQTSSGTCSVKVVPFRVKKVPPHPHRLLPLSRGVIKDRPGPDRKRRPTRHCWYSLTSAHWVMYLQLHSKPLQNSKQARH